MKDTHTHSPLGHSYNAALVLADGGVFFGFGLGADHASHQYVEVGELCFNTSMTGYQEILTDPSYTGQLITFTAPHIGNTGANPEDWESKAMSAAGLVMRDIVSEPSNFRSTESLDMWLKARGKAGIMGIDTRALTRRIRENGTQNATIYYVKDGMDATQFDNSVFLTLLQDAPSMQGRELASEVSTDRVYQWEKGLWRRDPLPAKHHVVAVDFGVKHAILRCLVDVGCKVTVVPARSSAAEILALKPAGVFLSNGPGDPAATAEYALPMIQDLLDTQLPLFGICLGHQLLAQALGCKTEKMHQGHRGGNHPVQVMANARVEITSQNHGFVVQRDTIPDDVVETHISLFDGSNEGIAHKTAPVFSVQHHPEASPGPHDSHLLFAQFVQMMDMYHTKKAA